MIEATETAPKIFNGRYIIHNRETSEHRTFRIRTQSEDARFAPGERIISLLTGPDNGNDYMGFGFVDDAGIRVWRSKQGGAYERHAEVIWSLGVDASLSEYAETYQLLLEGRCVRCNRALTTPESIESGIGPICAGR